MVNRGEMNPLHSLPGLDFMFFLGFSLGLWPIYCLAFGLLFLKTLSLFLYVLFWHRGVPWLLYEVVIVLQDCLTYYST